MVSALLSLALTACSGAPKKDAVTAAIKKIMPSSFEVVAVNTVPDIAGLYEVLVRIDRQPFVLYVNKNAKLVVSGSIIEVESKKNLTSEAKKRITDIK
jgi:hypothetical protein